MFSFSGRFLSVRIALTTAAVGALLFSAALLSGCNKGGDDAPAQAPAASAAPGTGAPAETAEQKAAEDAAHAQSSSIRQQHSPMGK